MYYLHYYNKLSKNERKLYKKILKGIKSLESIVEINATFKKTEICEILRGIIYDHCELFYLDINSIEYSNNKIYLKYLLNLCEIGCFENKIVRYIKNNFSICKEKTDYDKVHFVHDFIAKTVVYDSNKSSFLSIINKGSGNCMAIAMLAKLIFDYLNICSILCENSKNKHAWNLVKIDNKWYELDITKDINKYGVIIHTFLNITTDEMVRMCGLTNNTNIKCLSNDANYYQRNNLIFNNIDQIVLYAVKNVKDERKFEFKINDDSKYDYTEIIINKLNNYGLHFKYGFKETHTQVYVLSK